MEFDEFRQRLEAARARAALQRLEAVEALAKNVDLRRENGEAFVRQRAGQHREDRQIVVRSNRIRSADSQRRR
jgi:hypothetical protein